MDMNHRLALTLTFLYLFQFDSPGFCAAYCFYSLMDEAGMVVDYYVATKDMVPYSSLMGTFFISFLP
jgi:hypothetical protein